MENKTLDILSKMVESIIHDDWKASIDSLVHSLRKIFVFDNLVIYLSDNENPPEVVYARSLGRGRQAEADAAWGENMTNQVLATGKFMQLSPQGKEEEDRVLSPYLLGLPLKMLTQKGVLILIRFGGPEFTSEQVELAKLFAAILAHVFERHFFNECLIQFENVKHQTQLQDDFISTISHDFNTPLGFIKGYTTSLLRSDIEWDQNTVLEFLTIIDQETDKLQELIDNILDTARLQSGSMLISFQKMRIEPTIRDVKNRIETQHPGRHIECL